MAEQGEPERQSASRRNDGSALRRIPLRHRPLTLLPHR